MAGFDFKGAREAWDDRISRLALGKRNWQIAVGCSVVLNFVLAGGFTLLALRSHAVPVIIKEDALGELAAWGLAEDFGKLEEKHYVATLARWVRLARSVSTDKAVQAQWIEDVYGTASDPVEAILSRHYKAANPYERAKQMTVSVTVRTVQRIAGDTWQVRWIEERRDKRGAVLGRDPWQGLVTVQVDQPKTVADVLRNPSGIVISDLNWSPEVGDALQLQ